jgi:asparagine synthetase B (glutamine-hydrolysing)
MSHSPLSPSSSSSSSMLSYNAVSPRDLALIISSNGHSKYVVGAQSSGGVDSSAVRAHQDALRFIRNSELEVTMSTPSGGKFVCVLCLCD